MAEGPHGEDPGWFSAKGLLWLLIPGLGIQRAQRDATDALGVLRVVFTSFSMALLFIGVVVAFLASGSSSEGTMSAGVVAAGVAGYGAISLFVPRLVEPPLDCSGPPALLASYRTRFFLRIAIAEAAALLGFVGFFLTGEWWLYPLGAFFSFVGFARLAPTRSNLDREQEVLNASGCGQSLMSVLTTPTR